MFVCLNVDLLYLSAETFQLCNFCCYCCLYVNFFTFLLQIHQYRPKNSAAKMLEFQISLQNCFVIYITALYLGPNKCRYSIRIMFKIQCTLWLITYYPPGEF